jgi:hypothetical protein
MVFESGMFEVKIELRDKLIAELIDLSLGVKSFFRNLTYLVI